MNLIEPRTLKGFRDYLPEAMIPRERLIATAQQVYRSFGYSPIDTPALEFFEILAGKGGEETDRQMYQFEDHGGRRVGMRFDLTVPLARFAEELGFHGALNVDHAVFPEKVRAPYPYSADGKPPIGACSAA